MNLVLIEWIDSHSSDTWRPIDTFEERAAPLPCRTVGWLVHKSKTMTVIVNSLAGGGDLQMNACGEMAIPNVCIQRVSVLRREK